MKAAERLVKIVHFIETQGFASVKDLSLQYHVSEMTIRRDLDKLAADDRIIRTYGGGASIPTTTNRDVFGAQSVQGTEDTSSLFCESDVLIVTSMDPKYNPIVLGDGG